MTNNNILLISDYEDRDYHLSYSSTSKGRASQFLFLCGIQSSRYCFVKLYPRKSKFFLICESSAGAHSGTKAQCCVAVYDNIIAATQNHSLSDSIFMTMSEPEDQLVHPTRSMHRSADIGHKKHTTCPDLQKFSVWPSDPPPHISVGTWDLGRYLESDLCSPRQISIGTVSPPKPPQHDEAGWTEELHYTNVKVYGPTRSYTDVNVYKRVHEDGRFIHVGVSTGLFHATILKTETGKSCKTHRFYDAQLLYDAKERVLQGAFIQQVYQSMVKRYKVHSAVCHQTFLPPSLQDFTEDFHCFIVLQVKYTCISVLWQ